MIRTGARAPLFSISDQRGRPFELAKYLGKSNVLLLFLPAAFTPICSTELPALAALSGRFLTEAETVVAAVTADGVPSNREWIRRCGADSIFILSDFYPHGAVSQAYGAWLRSDGIPDRATVLIGKDGTIKYAESVGKFGKRSIPQLLSIASTAAGRTPAPAGAVVSASMPLDLPVIFVTQGCGHCEAVLALIRDNKAESHFVVRDVSPAADPTAINDLLAINGSGVVPTLFYRGTVVSGEEGVIRAVGQLCTQIKYS